MKFSSSLPQEMYGEQLGEHELIYTCTIYYWPSMRSKWLDIGLFLCCILMDWDEVELKNNANIKAKNKP